MDDNTQASASSTEGTPSGFIYQSDLMARYRWIYDDLCRYCNDMWASIASTRSRAVEHVIFSATLLGLYLALAAGTEYRIGWWGLISILLITSVTVPHLWLVVSVVKTDEYHLKTIHADSPFGEPEKMLVASLEKKAKDLREQSEKGGKLYVVARNAWFIGLGICSALGVLEWFL